MNKKEIWKILFSFIYYDALRKLRFNQSFGEICVNSDENIRTEILHKKKKRKGLKPEDKYLNVSLPIQFVSTFSDIYSSKLPMCVIVNFTKKSLG